MFVAGLGVPRDVIDLCHDDNVLVVNMCGKVRHAIAAVEAGCDLVIAQGTEAGGHTGTVATMPLVPQIVDAVGDRVPVVAAGGIFDGRGLAAALDARCRRRVGRHALHRDARGARRRPATRTRCSRPARTARSSAARFTGKTLRVVRNERTQHFEEHPEELKPFPEQLMGAVGRRLPAPRRRRRRTGVDPSRSATRRGRASARSTSSSRRATSSSSSSTRPRRRSAGRSSAAPDGSGDVSTRRARPARSALSALRDLLGEVVLVHHRHELLEARPSASSRASACAFVASPMSRSTSAGR